jgi:hypothetical protein
VKVSCVETGVESSMGIGGVWIGGMQDALPGGSLGEAWRTRRARIACAGAGLAERRGVISMLVLVVGFGCLLVMKWCSGGVAGVKPLQEA